MTKLALLFALAGSDDPELDAHLLKQRAFFEIRSGTRKAEPRHLAMALAEHGADDDRFDAGVFTLDELPMSPTRH